MEKLTLTAFLESPELYQRLLVERNQNWMPHVERCLTENAGCFVVVGAAHLVGKDGLPVLAREEGLQGHSAVSRCTVPVLAHVRTRTPGFTSERRPFITA